MSEPAHKPHGIGWYASWGVAALVLYVVAFCPVCWLASKVPSAAVQDDLVPLAYRPLGLAYQHSPFFVKRAIATWGSLGDPVVAQSVLLIPWLQEEPSPP